jgi:HEAT repeat protein
VAPLTPGRYLVKGVFAQSRYPNQDPVRAESGSISFEIVPTPPTQLRKRVSELVKDIDLRLDARRVAPLLGFTGDPSALPPLMDILYSADDGARAAAADGLRYFDRQIVKQSLLTSLRTRGPRDRMVHFLIVTLGADRAEVSRLLLQWLADPDVDARAAAVEGLRLANRVPKDPTLFAPLAAMLKDPVARVRQVAASAVGGYQDAAALEALKAVVRDPDPDVSEQATVAVGWVAESSTPSSATRKDAIEVLRSLTPSGGAAGRQALYWLARIGDK